MVRSILLTASLCVACGKLAWSCTPEVQIQFGLSWFLQKTVLVFFTYDPPPVQKLDLSTVSKIRDEKNLGHSEKNIFNKHFQGANSELNSLYFSKENTLNSEE